MPELCAYFHDWISTESREAIKCYEPKEDKELFRKGGEEQGDGGARGEPQEGGGRGAEWYQTVQVTGLRGEDWDSAPH